MAPLIRAVALSAGSTPEMMKKAVCMTVLMRLPRPAFSEMLRASMLKNLMRRLMMSSCMSRVRRLKTSSLGYSELSRKTPPSLMQLSMS